MGKPRKKPEKISLGGGFILFKPLFGEDEPNLMHIVQRGWFNHQLVSGWKMKVPFEMVQFFGGTC